MPTMGKGVLPVSRSSVMAADRLREHDFPETGQVLHGFLKPTRQHGAARSMWCACGVGWMSLILANAIRSGYCHRPLSGYT
jgi:hypothetical protein